GINPLRAAAVAVRRVGGGIVVNDGADRARAGDVATAAPVCRGEPGAGGRAGADSGAAYYSEHVWGGDRFLTLTIPAIILYESFLSYLGLGIQPPMASLGSLIAEGADQMNPIRIYWWLIGFPAGFLVITLVALNFLGDGLRDAW